MKKRIYYLMFAAIITCGAISFTACSKDDDNNNNPPVLPDDDGGNSSSDEIGYIKRSWDEAAQKVIDEPMAVKAQDIRGLSPNEFYSGAYYVSGSYTLDGYLGVKKQSTMDLILCDGAEFRLKELEVGQTALLRIFGQEKGTGKLIIEDPNDGCPAIGGNSSPLIEIHGGVITVKGADGAAAIGAGWWDYGGLMSDRQEGYFSCITIYGGTINATGGGSAAGIGGGYMHVATKSHNGDIYIFGGDITATGGGYYRTHWGGAGIGGGCGTIVQNIKIWGGNIKATGGSDAAGIGRGEEGAQDDMNIYISGGTIVAEGGNYAAGIGGGDRENVISINISGGTITAYAGKDGAGIGGGEDGNSGAINITGGIIRAYGDRNSSGSHNGYGAGIGGGQDGSVGTIIIKGGDIEAYGGEDGAGIGTGEEYGSDIISGTIEIHGGKVFAQGKGYGAGIGAGEDATFGVLGISGGRVDAHAGSDCGPWSGGIGAYHSEHEDGCHIGWAGWQRIYIGAGMRLWTYSPNVGYIENVNTAGNQWWDFVHQRPQVAFGVCDHEGWAVCPLCYPYTIQLGGQ